MALVDKIYAYFEREPKLHVLFVFDNDTAYSLTTELKNVEWRDYHDQQIALNLDHIVRAIKCGNYRWLWSVIVSISIGMFAVFLISSIIT